MKGKRKRYDPAFKAKVALEAIKEEQTISQLAADFQVHPNLIVKWKQQLKEQACQLFAAEKQSLEIQQLHETQSQLYQQIGELTVENQWLKKKLQQ